MPSSTPQKIFKRALTRSADIAAACSGERVHKRTGATPVLVDVDEATYTMDPASLAEAITESYRRRGFKRFNLYIVHRLDRFTSGVLLVAKHYPARDLLRYAWPILVAQALWGGVALRHGRLLSFLRGKIEGLAMFRSFRPEAAPASPETESLPEILEQSEAEILRLQRSTGFDLYWRLYFALT